MDSVSRILGESMTSTGSIAPVMVGIAPALTQRKKRAMDPKKRKKSAVSKIIGEASIIPDDAEELHGDDSGRTTADDDKAGDEDNDDSLQHPEKFIDTSLAIVAPDLTPNGDKKLDPALIPNLDPVIMALLGYPKPGTKQEVEPAKEDPKEAPKELPISTEVESKQPDKFTPKGLNEGNLPSGPMPLPPGEFMRPIAENKGDKPKVELVMGSSSGIISESSGELGCATMPAPTESNPERTMDAFRRFHKIA